MHQLAMEGEEPVPTGGGGGQGALTRLLVCHSQAGCIIGKCAPQPAPASQSLLGQRVCAKVASLLTSADASENVGSVGRSIFLPLKQV